MPNEKKSRKKFESFKWHSILLIVRMVMQRKRRKNERRCCDKQTVIQRFEKSRSRRIYPASRNTVLCSAGIGAEPQQAKESPTSASAEMGDLGRLYIQRHCLPLLLPTVAMPWESQLMNTIFSANGGHCFQNLLTGSIEPFFQLSVIEAIHSFLAVITIK